MFSKKIRSYLKIAGTALGLTASHLLLAQCPSSIPNLGTYQRSNALITVEAPCLPKTISVINQTAGTTNLKYYYDYKGGNLPLSNFVRTNTHTFTTPGEYTIIQYSEKEGFPLLFCEKIVVSDTLAPTASLLTCSNGDAKINFDAEQQVDYEKYLIEWGDGDIDEIFAGYKTASHTYPTNGSYQIKAMGINPSTGCHGGTAIFDYAPTTINTIPPTLSSIEVIDQIHTTITLQNPAKLPLKLLSKIDNANFEQTGTVTNREYAQLQVATDSLNVVCYKLEAVDNCLTDYHTDILCTAPFSVVALKNGNEIYFSTAPPTSGSGITKIQLVKDGQPWEELNVEPSGNKQTISDTDLSCGHAHCYQLLVHYGTATFKSLNKCSATHREMCGLLAPLYIPTAFSPNGDAINDLFEIKGNLTTSFEITIYNKWGAALFYSNDQSVSWDGNYQQKPVAIGTYTYVIRLKDQQGKELKKIGAINLLR